MLEGLFKKSCSNAIIPCKNIDNSPGYELFNCYTTTIKKKSEGLIETGLIFEGNNNLLLLIAGDNLRIGGTLIEIKQEYIGSNSDVIVKVNNLSNDDIEIQPYTLISKIYILKTFGGEVNLVNTLEESVRGEKGFGSSGIF